MIAATIVPSSVRLYEVGVKMDYLQSQQINASLRNLALYLLAKIDSSITGAI